MKKTILMAVISGVVGLGFVSNASAKTCEFYQWPWHHCMAEAKPAPAPAPKVERIEKGEKIVLEGIYFDTGSSKIKKESFAVLDSNIEKINNSKSDVKIVVVGYTDDRGSDALNNRLSLARANSVKNYFVSKGVVAGRISAEGKGKADPVADNKTDAGRAKNRRIELQAR